MTAHLPGPPPMDFSRYQSPFFLSCLNSSIFSNLLVAARPPALYRRAGVQLALAAPAVRPLRRTPTAGLLPSWKTTGDVAVRALLPLADAVRDASDLRTHRQISPPSSCSKEVTQSQCPIFFFLAGSSQKEEEEEERKRGEAFFSPFFASFKDSEEKLPRTQEEVSPNFC